MLCICSVCHQVSHTAPNKVSVRKDCRVVYALLRIGALAMTSVLRCTSQELLGVGNGCMATCNHDCLKKTILDLISEGSLSSKALHSATLSPPVRSLAMLYSAVSIRLCICVWMKVFIASQFQIKNIYHYPVHLISFLVEQVLSNWPRCFLNHCQKTWGHNALWHAHAHPMPV